MSNVRNNNEVQAKAIFNMGIARSLVKDYGHRIVDMKPRKDNPQTWLPFFEVNDTLIDDLQKVAADRKKRREEREAAATNGEPIEQED